MKTIPKMLLMAALALSASVVMPSTHAADLPPAAARSPIVVYPQLATRSAGANDRLLHLARREFLDGEPAGSQRRQQRPARLA